MAIFDPVTGERLDGPDAKKSKPEPAPAESKPDQSPAKSPKKD